MADWQPGDLALCVNVQRLNKGLFIWTAEGLVKGRIYQVVGLMCDRDDAEPLLILADDPDAVGGRLPLRFVKVTPKAEDAEDRETIRLLKGERLPA